MTENERDRCPSCGHDGLPPLVCEHCGHRWYLPTAPAEGLREAAEALSDTRTLDSDGFWVLQKVMRRLDEALGRGYEYSAQPAAPAEGLREAAFRVVTLTDNLRQWDEAHGYVINSERDVIAGWLDAAWADLRTALARPTP